MINELDKNYQKKKSLQDTRKVAKKEFVKVRRKSEHDNDIEENCDIPSGLKRNIHLLNACIMKCLYTVLKEGFFKIFEKKIKIIESNNIENNDQGVLNSKISKDFIIHHEKPKKAISPIHKFDINAISPDKKDQNHFNFGNNNNQKDSFEELDDLESEFTDSKSDQSNKIQNLFGKIISKRSMPRHLAYIKVKGRKPVNINHKFYTEIGIQLRFRKKFLDSKIIRIDVFIASKFTNSPIELEISDEQISS